MTALVTGGGTGVGRAIAVALAATGPVVVAGRRAAPLRETVEQITSAGGTAEALELDVADRDSVRSACTTLLERHGAIDVLVNNAGYSGPSGTVSRGEADAWTQVLTVNTLAPVWLCAELVPAMVARGAGYVLNINSLQGSRSFPGFAQYGASKAALMRFTDSLAAELDGTGVIALDLSPGLVRTDMTTAPDLAAVLDGVPEDEWTPVERVAAVAAALVSGRYDVLHGRFVHAEDDLDDLAARIATANDDARRLRMTPTLPDPLLD